MLQKDTQYRRFFNDFKPEKAKEILLYLADRLKNKNRNKYWILKILYFADLKHLAKYGRTISGDVYYALEKGPVPSKSYDIIKHSEGCGDKMPDNFEVIFDVIDSKCIPKRNANLKYLSETDIECLKESIKENKNLDFLKLCEKSHDSAYNKTLTNSKIKEIDIVEMMDEDGLLLDYINSR